MNDLEEKIYFYLENLESKCANSQHSKKEIISLLNFKKEIDKLENNRKGCQELLQENLSEEEEKNLEEEIIFLQKEKHQLLEKVKEKLLKNEKNKHNVLIEIRPGAGGDEAGLFAADLYRMYCKFADRRGWKVETIETKVDSLGNFSFVAFLVKGQEAFKWLKYEAGVHRVQRVPITESKGRLQTSTASVVILPEINDIEIKIDPNDLKIESYRSSGAGGQHVNTTDSAVRITHKPSKLVATSQDGRSQHDNKEKALTVLKSRLYAKNQEEQTKKIGNLRSLAIGTAERFEKIRTYNFPQDRVTEHRLKKSRYLLENIMKGDLEDICRALLDYEIEKIISENQT